MTLQNRSAEQIAALLVTIRMPEPVIRGALKELVHSSPDGASGGQGFALHPWSDRALRGQGIVFIGWVRINHRAKGAVR